MLTNDGRYISATTLNNVEELLKKISKLPIHQMTTPSTQSNVFSLICTYDYYDDPSNGIRKSSLEVSEVSAMYFQYRIISSFYIVQVYRSVTFECHSLSGLLIMLSIWNYCSYIIQGDPIIHQSQSGNYWIFLSLR